MSESLFSFNPRSNQRPMSALEQESQYPYEPRPAVRSTAARPIAARFALALWFLAKGYEPASAHFEDGVVVYIFPPEARREMSAYHATKNQLQDIADNAR
jgi:hypothetical protein